MKARLTSDLFKDEYAKLTINTCLDMMNHMQQILKFTNKLGLEWSLSASNYRKNGATLTVTGENLIPNLDRIREYILRNGWGK
tara:strand:- start:292 stop:540 length:249 start_codon:yes stop_codon:yes gene_type:complete